MFLTGLRSPGIELTAKYVGFPIDSVSDQGMWGSGESLSGDGGKLELGSNKNLSMDRQSVKTYNLPVWGLVSGLYLAASSYNCKYMRLIS
jgi:hypothetical protein